VLFVERDQQITVKVADFDISKSLDKDKTSNTLTTGTQPLFLLLF